MSTTSARREQIAASLRDKEYRDLFVAAEINTGLPFQIRAMRQDRGWSQRELAERVDMTQEGISRLESLDYGKFTLTTLRRLASAFDVALAVRFVPFSELVDRAANLSPEDLAVPDYEHDSGLGSTTDRAGLTRVVFVAMPQATAPITYSTSAMDTGITFSSFPVHDATLGQVVLVPRSPSARLFPSLETSTARATRGPIVADTREPRSA